MQESEHPEPAVLRAARNWLGLSIDDMAASVGLSRGAYHKIESNKTSARKNTTRRIIEFLRENGITLHSSGLDHETAHVIARNLPASSHLVLIDRGTSNNSPVDAIRHLQEEVPEHMSTRDLIWVMDQLEPLMPSIGRIREVLIGRLCPEELPEYLKNRAPKPLPPRRLRKFMAEEPRHRSTEELLEIEETRKLFQPYFEEAQSALLSNLRADPEKAGSESELQGQDGAAAARRL